MALPQDSKEALALEKFQEKVSDLKLNIGILMRFLRAKNLDLDDAETMLRTSEDWRVNNIYQPSILKGWTPPPELLLKFGGYHCGYDSKGIPVFYIEFVDWTPTRETFQKFTAFDVMLFAYRGYNLLYEHIVSKCQHQQIIMILNNQHIGFSTIFHEVQNWTGIETLRHLMEFLESNYPEMLGKAIMFNTARSFLWGWNLIKPFLSKHTLSKVSIFGTDETKWKPFLHKSLPLDSIPPQFGGTAKLNHVYDILYDGAISKLKDNNNDKDA